MCNVELYVVCYIAILSSRDSKLTVLIYTGVSHRDQSLGGVRLEVFKGVLRMCVKKSIWSHTNYY